MSIRWRWLIDLFSSTIFLLIFYLLELSSTYRGMLKPLTITVDLPTFSLSLFNPICWCSVCKNRHVYNFMSTVELTPLGNAPLNHHNLPILNSDLSKINMVITIFFWLMLWWFIFLIFYLAHETPPYHIKLFILVYYEISFF